MTNTHTHTHTYTHTHAQQEAVTRVGRGQERLEGTRLRAVDRKRDLEKN